MFCLSLGMKGQDETDLNLAKSLFVPAQPGTYSFQYKEENELQSTTRLLFTVYKNFVSSQDGQSCNFHPSCSVYTMEAIKKHGFTKGSLLGFDRLSRCHPLNREAYPAHEESGRCYDPVE